MNPTTDHEQGPSPVEGENPRRFRRSVKRQVGGVAKGMADYVGVDPLFFRIAFVVFSFVSGVGIFAYLGAWLLIPEEDDGDGRPLALTANVVSLILGFGVLVVGSIALTTGIDVNIGLLVPLGMVVLGAWVLNQRRDLETSTVAFAAPTAGGVPAPPSDPHYVPPPPASAAQDSAPPPPTPEVREPIDTMDPLPVNPSRLAGFPATSTPDSLDDVVAAFGSEPDPVAEDAPPPVPPPLSPTSGWAHIHPDGPTPRSVSPPGPPIVSITLAAAVVVVGALLVVRNLGGVDVDAGLLLGSVLAVLGVGLVASAFTRRALVLFPLAFFVSTLLAFAPLIDTTLAGGVGSRDIVVADSGVDLEASYSLGAGELLLDLTSLQLTEDRTVEVAVGAGYTEIRLPADLAVRVEASSTAGYVEALGVVEEGIANKVTVVGEPENAQPGTLTLLPSVTFGYVEVSRG